MADQTVSKASLPSNPFPPKNVSELQGELGRFTIRRQRQVLGAQLSLLQGGSYVAIADSWLDSGKISIKGRTAVVDNVQDLWIDK